MPRDLVSEELASMPRSAMARERVSSGRTRGCRIWWDPRLVAFVLATIAALMWSRTSGSPSPPLERAAADIHPGPVAAVVFSPDGRTLASSGFDHNVRLWDADRWEDGRLSGAATLSQPAMASALAFSPDGRTLATAAGRSLSIWTRDPSYRRELERTGESFDALAFSPDGGTLALGARDGTIRLWEMPAAREGRKIRGHARAVKTVVYSPDGKFLASGGEEGRVILWDAAKGTVARVLIEGGPEPIQGLSFSPDGRRLGVAAACSDSTAILLFDAETGLIRKHLFGHSRGIWSLAFSPDGRFLATVGVDPSIKLWDLVHVAKDPITVGAGHRPGSAAFSPDGRWLAYPAGEEGVQFVDMRKLRPDPAGLTDSAGHEERKPIEAREVLRALPAPIDPA